MSETKSEKKKFTYYPGCSSEASGMHLDKSLRAVAPELGLELETIEDWNCCGASVGRLSGGKLATAALSGRNLAQARKQGDQDVMTGCAACYLNTHGTNEKIKNDPDIKDKINQALDAAGMSYDGDLKVRHACEVIVNEVGIDAIRDRVTNPLSGLKVAGYVGCQTVRPFAGTEQGGMYDTYDQPEFLDDFIDACGAEAVPYDVKTNCCGGSVSVISPEKGLPLIKRLLDAAKDANADVIATPCPLCQQNVEMYQDAVNKKYGTDFKIPVVFYSQLMAVAFGLDAKKDAALDQHLIPATVLADMAKK